MLKTVQNAKKEKEALEAKNKHVREADDVHFAYEQKEKEEEEVISFFF